MSLRRLTYHFTDSYKSHRHISRPSCARANLACRQFTSPTSFWSCGTSLPLFNGMHTINGIVIEVMEVFAHREALPSPHGSPFWPTPPRIFPSCPFRPYFEATRPFIYARCWLSYISPFDRRNWRPPRTCSRPFRLDWHWTPPPYPTHTLNFRITSCLIPPPSSYRASCHLNCLHLPFLPYIHLSPSSTSFQLPHSIQYQS